MSDAEFEKSRWWGIMCEADDLGDWADEYRDWLKEKEYSEDTVCEAKDIYSEARNLFSVMEGESGITEDEAEGQLD